jgi:Leucine-rich repeat (LRR) protein
MDIPNELVELMLSFITCINEMKKIDFIKKFKYLNINIESNIERIIRGKKFNVLEFKDLYKPEFKNFRYYEFSKSLYESMILEINNISAFQYIPNEIGKLINLRILNLKGNSLTELPKSIGNLTFLLVLDISNNNLTSIPNEFIKLKYLEELNISNTHIVAIPKFQNLKKLSLNETNTTVIPYFTKIEEINIDIFQLDLYDYIRDLYNQSFLLEESIQGDILKINFILI